MENTSFSSPETESKSSGSFFGNIFSLLKSKKVLVGVTVASTLILGGTAGFLAWRLQTREEPISETPAAAGYTTDCSTVEISCPDGWEPSGSPYCEHPGSNTCKLKCCWQGDCSLTGDHAPWWQDSGETCWEAICGDDVCEGDENCGNCPEDCGECPPDECPFDVTPYVSRTGSLPSGYANCNGDANCLKLDLPSEYDHCEYKAEAYTDLPQDCSNQDENIKVDKVIGDGGTICFDEINWGNDCKAQLDIRFDDPEAEAGVLKTYLIDCGGGDSLACDTISREPTGELQPGDTVTISCSHSGDGFDYYNYRYTHSGLDGWALDFLGAQGNEGSVTYVIPPYDEPVTYQWECQACEAGGACGAWGENNCDLSFNVNPPDQAPPKCDNLTAHPTELPYFGGEVTLTVQASEGDGGALSYTWGSDAGSIDPNAASGDNKALWDLTSLTNDTYQPSTHYAWVKVSNDTGSSGCDDQDSCTADGEGCVLALDLAPFPEEDITCDNLTVSPSPAEIEIGDELTLTCVGSSRWGGQGDNPYPITRIDFRVYLDPKIGTEFDGFQNYEVLESSPYSVDVTGQGPTWSGTYPAGTGDDPIVIDRTGTWGVASRVCANVQGTVQCTNYATPSP